MFSTRTLNWIKVFTALCLLAAVLSISVRPVEAAQREEDGVIEADETIHDDVFMNASTVRVDGVIDGNLVANGSTVRINGTITGDAFLFGTEIFIGEDAVIEGNLFSGAETISISGRVDGSLAAGSSSLVLEPGAQVGRNLYYGGFNLEAHPGSEVGMDWISGNYQLVMDGTVGRDLYSGAASVEINGTIQRNVQLDLGDVRSTTIYFPLPPSVSETRQPGLRIGDQAVIGGNLRYTASVDQSSRIQSDPEGETIFQTPAPSELQTPEVRETRDPLWAVGRFAANTLRRFWENFFSLLVVGALMVLLAPGLFRHTAAQLRREPLPAAGFGLLTVILGYIAIFLAGLALLAVAILLAIISAGGLGKVTFGLGFAGLGFAGAMFTVLIFYVSKIIVSYIAGRWILSKLAPTSRAAESSFWGMALGVLLYSILRVIPLFGWLLAFVVIILGMGALWLAYRNRGARGNGAALAPVVETPAA